MMVRLLLSLFFLSALHATEPVKTHPRLLIRAEDLPELRSRMVPTNDVWITFKSQLVDKYLIEWKCASTWVRNADGSITRLSFTDEFGVTHYPTLGNGSPNPDWGSFLQRKACPEDDTGAHTGIQPLRSEVYAMVFAFMARLLKDQPGHEIERAEYLAAARECLMKVIEPASLGHPAPDADGRYIQKHLAHGGAANRAGRIMSTRSEERPRDGIYYFLLLDPDAPASADPRPAQPVTCHAQHDPAGKMGMLTSRSDATTNATHFHRRLAKHDATPSEQGRASIVRNDGSHSDQPFARKRKSSGSFTERDGTEYNT